LDTTLTQKNDSRALLERPFYAILMISDFFNRNTSVGLYLPVPAAPHSKPTAPTLIRSFIRYESAFKLTI
jgi:hypothetical protein